MTEVITKSTEPAVKTEGLQPLDLSKFNALRRKHSGAPELYQRLYLGLPKELRVAVRSLAAEAVKSRVAASKGTDEAMTALRLLGTSEQKALLADMDVRCAISIALDSPDYQVTLEMEQVLDSVHDRAVSEIVSEWEPRVD